MVSRLAHNQKDGGSSPPSATNRKKDRWKKMLFKKIHESKMPFILKLILYIVLLITVVYWALWIAYKLIDGVRALLHLFTDKGHFWFMILFMVFLALGAMVVMEYVVDVGYKPISLVLEWIRDKYELVKAYVENLMNSIKGVGMSEQ